MVFTLASVGSAAAAGEPASRPPRVQARVSEVEIRVLEGFPLQVGAVLRGELPEACSTIESIEERFVPDERTYHLAVSAVRPADTVCAQVLTPFEVRLPIVKAGLASGEYIVAADEASAVFVIRPVGEFPGIDVPSPEETVWVCFVAPGLCFAPPADWRRDGLAPVWIAPEYLSARLGGRFHSRSTAEPAELIPPTGEVHEITRARMGGAVGTRFAVSRGELWSEHLFVPCGPDLWCELWLEAPSEPLLDAAGEAFWRLVRFAIRY